MQSLPTLFRPVSALVATAMLVWMTVFLAACDSDNPPEAVATSSPLSMPAAAPVPSQSPEAASLQALTVYKSPTCGCCADWITHMQNGGFPMSVEEPANLDAIKDQHHIPVDARSCHTAVSAGGFVFEGHVPARYVQAFLQAPPEGALGLTVPGMPVGSPGMEVGDKFMPYKVWLLKADGSVEVFASVDSPEQQ